MKCPTCQYQNPAGSAYCQLCYEVLNRSAADRYIIAQKHANREQKGGAIEPDAPTESFSDSFHRILTPYLDRLRSLPFIVDRQRSIRQIVFELRQEIGLGLLIILIGTGVALYGLPVSRMRFYGFNFRYDLPRHGSVPYLVNFHSDVSSWSERGGRLDTPITTVSADETGSLRLQSDSQSGSMVTAKAWYRAEQTTAGQRNLNIAPSDPSLAPERLVINKQGRWEKPAALESLRVGRSVLFLAPRWPLGSRRAGSQWDEPIQWVDKLGDWKVFYRGYLHWTLDGFESCDTGSCANAHYRLEVTPSIWQAPAWARIPPHPVAWSGSGEGSALVDGRTRVILSNSYSLSGTLSIPISDIYEIPASKRIGRTPRHRHGDIPAAQPGRIIVQVKEKFDLRKL